MMKKLADRLYHADRRRNITAIAAISLSSMLIITALSTVMSIETMMRRSRQMLIGTQAEGVYLYISLNSFKKLHDSGHFDAMSLAASMGHYETTSSAGDENLILCAGEKTAALNFNDLTAGRWPQKDGEIVVDEHFVNNHGGEIRVGDKLSILLKTEGGELEQEAMVCGICRCNDMLDEARIYVSWEFFQKNQSGSKLRAYCRFEDGRYTDEDLMNFMREISPDAETAAFVNPTAGDKISAGAIKLISGLIVLTVLCSGLMIYTIYYISTVKNVVQYGQLKLIGVTRRQVRDIIRRHALRQYLTGLPIGCLLGMVLSYGLMPLLASYTETKGTGGFVVRPVYFLCAAALSYLVVCIGVHKPMRILAKTPPIHALGFTGSRREKPGKAGGLRFTPGRFARKNIRKRRKNTVLVAVSLSAAIVLFVTTMNVVHSLNVDSLLTVLNLFADIEIASNDFLYGVEVGEAGSVDKIPEEIRSELEKISEDVEMVYHYDLRVPAVLDGEDAERYCRTVLDDDSYRRDIIDDDWLYKVMVGRAIAYREKDKPIWMQVNYRFYDYEKISSFEIFEGILDREKFESGEYVLAVALDGKGDACYHAGDVVELYDEFPEEGDYSYERDENGRFPYFEALRTKEYKVLAVVSDAYRNQMQWGDEHTAGFEYILPAQLMEDFPGKPDLFMVTVNAPDAETLAAVEPYVKECLDKAGGEKEVSYRSKRTYKASLDRVGMTVSLFGNGMAVMVGMMALVSFINSSVSGIAERKEEFSTLQAIGMMKRLLLKVLRLENLYTVLFAVIPGYMIGQMMSVAAIHKASESVPYLKCDITLMPGILLAVFLAMISMLYPNRRTDIGDKKRVG